MHVYLCNIYEQSNYITKDWGGQSFFNSGPFLVQGASILESVKMGSDPHPALPTWVTLYHLLVLPHMWTINTHLIGLQQRSEVRSWVCPSSASQGSQKTSIPTISPPEYSLVLLSSPKATPGNNVGIFAFLPKSHLLFRKNSVWITGPWASLPHPTTWQGCP